MQICWNQKKNDKNKLYDIFPFSTFDEWNALISFYPSFAVDSFVSFQQISFYR